MNLRNIRGKTATNGSIRSLDFSAVAGIGIAVAGLAGGFALEHGRIVDLASLNSAVIVMGGTLGAVLLSTPGATLASAFGRCRAMLRRTVSDRQAITDKLVSYASLVRRAGVTSIESEVEAMSEGAGIENGFLRRALLLVVDGVNSQEVRRQLENDIASAEDDAEADARVFEQAGGYAPTIGIIGAVLGLIQVMKHLGNIDEVGRGIAAAFVSTLYGVAFANLLLLPLAARIRLHSQANTQLKELILEGVTAIAEGTGLHVVRMRLNAPSARTHNPVAHTSVIKVASHSA